MSHIDKEKLDLVNRTKKIVGQLEGVERALGADEPCADVLQRLSAVRGAINSLMGELMEDHIRNHMPRKSKSAEEAAEAPHGTFETTALAEYNRLRSEIRSRYAGVPVGYSESIFRPLGESLGLKLLTPYSFAKAIAEGTDVSAADKQTVDHQAEATRSRCGSTTARTPRPTCSASTSSPAPRTSRSRPSPRRSLRPRLPSSSGRARS